MMRIHRKRDGACRGGPAEALWKSGVDHGQPFEIVVCAAIGHATRQYDAALAALTAATEKE
jgi:hypothetical protein